MKIIDAFIFNNEIDMLYYRLSILYDHVDYFIIVEATRTFTGKEKPLYYDLNKNQERFLRFQKKIIHIIDDELEENPKVEEDELLLRTNKYWQNEYHQRNSIDIGIRKLDLSERSVDKLQDDDYIMISDVDEIPNINLLMDLLERNANKEHSPSLSSVDFNVLAETESESKHNLSKRSVDKILIAGCSNNNMRFSNPLNCCTKENEKENVFALLQDMYYYNITCKVMEYWIFAKILTYRCYKEMGCSPQMVRTLQEREPNRVKIVENGGWHFSYFGTSESIKNKLSSFSHQEFNTDFISNQSYIEYCIKNKKSIFQREFDKIVYMPINENNNLPPYYDIFFETT